MIYFDHNATSPLSATAREAWLRASEEFVGNPSSPHRLGARAETALSSAREKLAQILGCDPLDIVWTSGATESNNMVLHHLAAAAPHDAEVWISAIEHPCVLAPAEHYFGARVRLIPATRSGVVDLDWLKDKLQNKQPALVAIMAANNETGVLQPWQEALRICNEKEVPFFCDAVQWIGKLPASGLGGADWVSGCAHKFGGPRGVGFLKCPRKGLVNPLILGGEQEDGRRSGTENVPAILAMIAALEEAESAVSKGETKIRIQLQEQFETRLRKSLPNIEVIGGRAPKLWNTTAALMPQANCQQRWVVKLDKAGFAVSTGSACASGKEKPSHVLNAMGFTPEESSRMIRFSSGWQTTADDWQKLLDAIASVSKQMQS
jgi:cysteine desulfurase